MEKKKLLQHGNPAEHCLTLLSSDGTQCCPCGTLPLSKANKGKKDQDGGFQGNWLISQFCSVWFWMNYAQHHLSKGI